MTDSQLARQFAALWAIAMFLIVVAGAALEHWFARKQEELRRRRWREDRDADEKRKHRSHIFYS